MNNLSILREAEYKEISNITLDGVILDIGGGCDNYYQHLLDGENSFYSINIDIGAKPDKIVDIEKKFPFDDSAFDHAVCMNVLEHVFEFENVIAETRRVLKSGGILVTATPMVYHIHGGIEDDYLRYTQAALKRLFRKHGFEIISITPLGEGLFSFMAQVLRGGLPTLFLRHLLKRLAVFSDRLVKWMTLGGYERIVKRVPLGYLSVVKKID